MGSSIIRSTIFIMPFLTFKKFSLKRAMSRLKSSIMGKSQSTISDVEQQILEHQTSIKALEHVLSIAPQEAEFIHDTAAKKISTLQRKVRQLMVVKRVVDDVLHFAPKLTRRQTLVVFKSVVATPARTRRNGFIRMVSELTPKRTSL